MGLIKIRNICFVKNPVKRDEKYKLQSGRKHLQIMSDKGLVSRIHKELLKQHWDPQPLSGDVTRVNLIDNRARVSKDWEMDPRELNEDAWGTLPRHTRM